MEIRDIEAKIEELSGMIKTAREELDTLNSWRETLENAVKVLSIMKEKTGSDLGRYFTDVATKSAVDLIDAFKDDTREVRPAKGTAAAAGQALLTELHSRGNYMKPMEAVRYLHDAYGITIGLGKPGRETSDLSAALGHGKVKGLTVSRRMGWGLEEWRSQPRPVVNRSHVSEIKPVVESNVDVERTVSDGSIVEQESDEVERQH